MNIANHIQDLLYRYECVILPGFGAFLSQRQSAFIEEGSGSFHPPRKVLSFNSQLSKNDGLLANFIAETEKTTYSQANQQIAEFVENLEQSLREEDMVNLEHIGIFSYSKEEKIQFQPLEKSNFLTDSFGLESIGLTRIQREVYKEQAETMEAKVPVNFTPERRRTPAFLKYAAVGLITLGLGGYAGLNMYSNEITRHNIAEQQEAENQLQQQIQQATFVIDNPLPAITFHIEKQSGNFHLVAGAFRIEENAWKKVKDLRQDGHKARLIGTNKYGLHQVVYSSLSTRKEALKRLRKIKQENPAAWLLVQELK